MAILTRKSLTLDKDLEPILAEGLDNAQTERAELENRVNSQIQESVESVVQEVKDTTYSKDEVDRIITSVSMTLERDKESIKLLFSELSKQVSADGVATDEHFEEIARYIRFVDGNIELGNSSSPIQLKIMNDKISFRQAGEEVAWFSNNALYVTDGNFMKSLRVGKFAFVPRANGSLDFKKVGD